MVLVVGEGRQHDEQPLLKGTTMAHEMTSTDSALFHSKPAWHGLGVVVDDAPSPVDAVRMAGLDWEVEKTPISTVIEGPQGTVRVPIDTHQAIRRTDTGDVFTVVTNTYEPVQNMALAEFAESLSEQGDQVKIESIGSIRGGRKVYMLLKGESFSVRDKDEITPYILLANAHDSSMALRGVPTTIRVQCSNTLHMVINERGGNRGFGKGAGFSFNHTTNIARRVEEAKQMLKLYGRALDDTKQNMDTLASKDVTREQIQAFWLECYQRDFQPVPTEPTTRAENRKREKSAVAMNHMAMSFDRDRDTAGPTAWNMANAYTEWLQHHRRTQSDESRVEGNVFGDRANGTAKTFDKAHELVGA